MCTLLKSGRDNSGESTTIDIETSTFSTQTTESEDSLLPEIQRAAKDKWGEELAENGGARREWVEVDANTGEASMMSGPVIAAVQLLAQKVLYLSWQLWQ